MKGLHKIIIQNKRIRYEFEIKRNLTVIRGDSATGKTTLVDMVREYYELGEASAIELQCDKVCAVLGGVSWEAQLSTMKDAIVFVDEGNDFIMTDKFASIIQKTDNYYVIVTRENIPSLPYSVEEIYGIRNSGRYGTLARTYNEFYRLYRITDYNAVIQPETIITEDSNSGFQFFQGISEKINKISCISAGGKSNIFKTILENKNNNVLIIADGAAFGAEMERIMMLLMHYPNLKLYLPESFEWMILKAGVIKEPGVSEILQHPEVEIESSQYFSWERYFAALLVRISEGTYLKYNKRNLNPAYLQGKISQKLLAVMPSVEWN